MEPTPEPSLEPEVGVVPALQPPPVPVGRAGTFRSLRHRNYRLYFFGQLVSLTGTWMQTPALQWLVFTLTGQSRWPAWILAAQFLPTCLFGFFGGTLADRFEKRSLIFWTQIVLLLLALALAQLVLAETPTPWPYLLVAATIGLVLAVDFPARLAFVMDLVGREDLTNAVALNSLLFNCARLLGPLVGGLLLAWHGPALCFWANAVSYLALLTALLWMDGGLASGAPKRTEARPQSRNAFAYIAGHPRLLAVIALAGLMGLCGWPMMSLLPALSENVLATGRDGYLWLLSGTGFGALSAALTAATLGGQVRSRWFIAVGVALVTTGLLGLSQAEQIGVAVLCCVLTGFGLILFFSIGQAVVQLGAGEHNRGQVLGIWAMVISGAQPLGNLLIGPAADRWSEQQVLALQGIVLGTAAGLLFLVFIILERKHTPFTPRPRVQG